jgi:transcriptional regulator with GAF, ATPase, and Fis domain
MPPAACAIDQPRDRPPRADREPADALLGQSPAMQRLISAIPKLAASDATLLIDGETGTGKSVFAEAVHRASPRASRPWIVVDCSSIPPTLVESVLFGHDKGAFTGATAARPGAFEAADGGTVFLDEIGELPAEMQPKLLRLLETRTVTRIGRVEAQTLDVRIIAATHRDLSDMVRRGGFRSDLYYRLNVVRVHIPPLRERREDIALLCARFFAEAGQRRPSDAQLAAFASRDWPGNIRELRHAIASAALLEEVGGTTRRASATTRGAGLRRERALRPRAAVPRCQGADHRPLGAVVSARADHADRREPVAGGAHRADGSSVPARAAAAPWRALSWRRSLVRTARGGRPPRTSGRAAAA